MQQRRQRDTRTSENKCVSPKGTKSRPPRTSTITPIHTRPSGEIQVIRLSITLMDNDLARFVAEFRDVDFSHRDYIISGIEAGTVSLHSVSENSTQSIAEIARTFERRSRMLSRHLEAEYCDAKQLLLNDTADLCKGLREHLDDQCDFWIFSHSHGGMICVYIAHQSRNIMGCVRGTKHLAGDSHGPNAG